MVGIGLPGCRAPLQSRIQLDGASDCLSNESCRCGIACKNLDSPWCKRCAAVRAAATIEVKVLASFRLALLDRGRPARFRQLEWRNAFRPCIAGRGRVR